MRSVIFLLLINNLICICSLEGQDWNEKIYVYWGWNRASYSQSDISFRGRDYNFTLEDVDARDRQTPFSFHNYFAINRITIPQTNLRVGYFFKDKLSISFGADHMKYVVVQDQVASITGRILNTATEYNGTYEHTPIELTKDFLKYEHTDGLNYLNLEIRRHEEIKLKFIKGAFGLNPFFGAGFGLLVPKTNCSFMGQPRHDAFHLSGFGLAGVIGVNLIIKKLLFLQSELKPGFIAMPDIRITADNHDKAAQHFTFIQFNFGFGILLPTRKKTVN